MLTGTARRLASSLLLWSIAYNMVLPFLPILALDRGATPFQAGLLQGAAYAGAALALLPLGRLADRVGRRRTLIAAWSVGALGTAALAVPGPWPVLIPGALLTLAGAGAMPALAALAVDSVPPDRQRRAIAMVFAAEPGGLLVGSALAGVIADAWGLGRLPLLAGALSLAAAAALRPIHPDRPQPAADVDGRGGDSLRALFLTGIPAAGALLLLTLPAAFMTPFLRDQLGLSLSATGLTNSQLAVGQLAWSALFAVWPGDSGQITLNLGPVRNLKLSRGTAIAMGVCLAADAAFGALFPRGGVGLVVVAMLLRGAHFSLQPLGMALVSETTGSGEGLATRFSLLALLMGLATAAAPVLSGALYERAPALPFYVAGAAGAVGAAALLGIATLSRRTTT